MDNWKLIFDLWNTTNVQLSRIADQLKELNESDWLITDERENEYDRF